MKRLSAGLWTLFLTVVLALPAFAADSVQGGLEQTRNPPPFITPMKHPGPPIGGFCRDFGVGFTPGLDLSREQRDKMKELKTLMDRETRDLKYDLAIKHMEMHKLYTDVKTRESDLLAKERELSGIHQKLHESMVKLMIDSRKILTAEQLARLDHMPPPPPIMGPGMMGPGAPGGPCRGM